jgi:conjugal transfer pilus assembly protein TraU
LSIRHSFLWVMGWFVFTTHVAAAEGTCVGKFINPITDVCWSCVFPISIGGIKLNSGSNRRDTDNPATPICGCIKKGIPIPGLAVGFWEPVRLVDVTRNAMCLVNMGGLDLGFDRYQGSTVKNNEAGEHNHHSFYHTHYYMYPLIAWLELLMDFGCLEGGSMDVVYMSEFDPTYKNDANFLNPEVFLFANPLAQAACAADCIAANVRLPSESLFWCAGCLGSLYPFSGHVQGHVGGVQASSLLAVRTLAKLHRIGIARKTSTSDGSFNGALCRKAFAPKLTKKQYRLQMTYPVAASKGPLTCNPLGMSDMLYGSMKEFPFKGEDFGYLIWRKRNCCLL